MSLISRKKEKEKHLGNHTTLNKEKYYLNYKDRNSCN